MTEEERKERRREICKRYRERHPERVRASARKWHEAHPGERSKQQSAYNKRNRKACSARQKMWALANPEKIKAYQEKWKLNNHDYLLEMWRAHTITRRSKAGRVTRKDLKELKDWQGDICAYCNEEMLGNFEVDHILPIAKGGTGDPYNLVLACMACNRGKGALLPTEWESHLLEAR